MKLSFDIHTFDGFREARISDVHVWTETEGCAGLKVFFEEKKDGDKLLPYPQKSGITLWVSEDDAILLDGGQIAVANNRIYFSSQKVQGRCGCGTSISFTKSAISMDMAKLHRIGSQLSALPDIQNALHDGKRPK